MHIQILNYSLIIFQCLLGSCCLLNDESMEQSLAFSGENRSELESVLRHYKNTPQKLSAARFLIKNMYGHMEVDSISINKLQPVYEKYVSISEKYNWFRSEEWQEDLNKFWKEEQCKSIFLEFVPVYDVKTVKADWLINEIDRSFKTWKENVYTQNLSFEDFCKYILPYRPINNIHVGNSRDVFYKRHAGIFCSPDKDFKTATDSLLFKYRFLMYNNLAASSMPIYNTATLEYLKRSSCNDKTWYNYLLLSALGMAVTIDFVPEWGNRPGKHQWNSLIINGETYPFEPFWDEERWKYKRIYNNVNFDYYRGKFRLPKVYRLTFETHLEGPMGDDDVKIKDIPPLLRNPFITDVSSQYFHSIDAKVNITERIPEKTSYCYLCVFNTKEWLPIQWGKINIDKTVTFINMGKDIIYLPVFYRNGYLSPAASPFLINQNGCCEELKCGNKKTTITIRRNTSHLMMDEISEFKRILSGSYLIGYDALTNSTDTIYSITDSMDFGVNHIILDKPIACKNIHLITSRDTIGLCEIAFYEEENENKPISNIKVSSNITSLTSNEQLKMIIDNLSATGFKGLVKNGPNTNNDILFDLGKEHVIKSFSFIPYTSNNFSEGDHLDIYYWDDQWVLAASKIGTGHVVTFENIPIGTIYKVKNRNSGAKERIFTYDKGIINWF